MDENEVNVQREDALRDVLIERLRAAGIDVVTDHKEGERVLQQENSKAGFIPDLSHVDGDTLDYSLMEDVNAQRSRNNHHFISDRNQLTMEEKETQQKAWRAVFKSLSESNISSDPRRRANAPVNTYSASKPIVDANIGKISRIYDQLNELLREINNKDFSREQFANILAGSLGLRLDKDKVSRYTDEPITLRNGEKVSLRISNHPAISVNFIRWNNNENTAYGFVFRDGTVKGSFRNDNKVDYLEIDYHKDSIDNATVNSRRDFYRDIINGIKFMLEEGSLEMMPFPDHLNASGVFKKPLEEFRKEHPEMLFHQEIEDAPSELATILSGGISREEVEEAYNSKLVQRWIKANNSNEVSTKKGFDLFGIGPSLIHEFARGRLGIDNRYDPGSNVFFNSWDWLGEYLRAAKENGLSPAIADKYDLRFGSDDVKHIQEHPDAIFTDAEMEEIEKHMKPKGFEDFKAVLRSFSEAQKVKAEEERIKGYEGGDALTKAFMLWKIALSRLKSEHYGDSRWFFKQRTWHAPDGSHGILTSNQKIRPGETEGFTYDLKSDVAKRIMYMIATSPIAEKLPLLEARNEDKKRNPSLCSFGYHTVSITDQMKRDVMAGQPMFLRNGDHQAYGFVFNGTIYLDPRVATAETPIHEYTHLWAEVLRQRNPKEWDHIVTMMKDSPQLWEHVEQSYAARWKVQLEKGLLTQKEYDCRVADEALAQFSGKRGYEKLRAFAGGQPDGKGILDAMLEILKEFWNRVSEFFGVHYLDKEQVADRVLYDLLQGVNPLDYKREDIQGLREAQAEAESAVREDGGVPVVIPRTDLSEHDIRTAERAARTAVIERITDYGAHCFSDEQRDVISHYRAMFTSDTSTGELYNRLLESVLDDPEVRRCPREWAQAAAEELQDMAVGKVHSEEENIGFKR